MISVETDDVGVDGESKDGPWMVIAGLRAYKWRVDSMGVFAVGSFTGLQLVVSSLVVGDGGDSWTARRRCLYPRISVVPLMPLT